MAKLTRVLIFSPQHDVADEADQGGHAHERDGGDAEKLWDVDDLCWCFCFGGWRYNERNLHVALVRCGRNHYKTKINNNYNNHNNDNNYNNKNHNNNNNHNKTNNNDN